jgi:hypothetical protein
MQTCDTHTFAWSQPPEVVFNDVDRVKMYLDNGAISAYDSWSVGILMLEMILGSPNVSFAVLIVKALVSMFCHRFSP